MDNKQLSVTQNLLWNSIGSFTYLLCQWIITSILVFKVTGDSNLAGKLTLAITITNIFYNMACFNVRPYLVSDLKGAYNDGSYLSFRFITCIIGYIACFLYILFFGYSIDKVICIMLYMLYKIGEAVVDVLHSFEQRKSRMDIGGKSLLVRGIVSIVSFYFTISFSKDINISILVMVVSNFIIIALYDIPSANNFVYFNFSFDFVMIKKMFIEFLPLTIASFLSLIAIAFPKQMLELIEGNEVLAIYGYISSPTVIIQVAATYVFNPFLTQFASYLNNHDFTGFKNLVKKIFVVMGIISLIAIVGSYIFGNLGLRILYNEDIASYSNLLGPIIVFTSLNAFIWLLWNLLIVLRVMKQLMIINCLGLLLVLFISKIVIQQFSMIGTTIVLIIYTLFVLGLMLWLLYNQFESLKDR